MYKTGFLDSFSERMQPLDRPVHRIRVVLARIELQGRHSMTIQKGRAEPGVGPAL
jgi:hypothetical protein